MTSPVLLHLDSQAAKFDLNYAHAWTVAFSSRGTRAGPSLLGIDDILCKLLKNKGIYILLQLSIRATPFTPYLDP